MKKHHSEAIKLAQSEGVGYVDPSTGRTYMSGVDVLALATCVVSLVEEIYQMHRERMFSIHRDHHDGEWNDKCLYCKYERKTNELAEEDSVSIDTVKGMIK